MHRPSPAIASAAGHQTAAAHGDSLFAAAMGDAFHSLHPTLQAFHALRGCWVLQGKVQVEAPANPVAGLIARLLGAPRRPGRGGLRFVLDSEPQREVWTRGFPRATMVSTLRPAGPGAVVETLGAARLVLGLRAEGGALVMELQSMHFLGVRCPGWLLPRITAREHAAGRQLHFEVTASVPLAGRVTGYRGHLDVGLDEEAPG